MSKKISKDFIFEENEKGELKFKGDFDGLYKNESDPWNQSGLSQEDGYYSFSREEIVNNLKNYEFSNILEIGCGHAHLLKLIDKKFPSKELYGFDISVEAIKQAQNLHEYNFSVIDIRKSMPQYMKGFYDIVILNQLLWYILYDIDQVFDNLRFLTDKNGKIFICNAFIDNQKYGKEIIAGYNGLLDYIKEKKELRVIHTSYTETQWRLNNGLVIIENENIR